MIATLIMTFDTAESTRNLTINCPKEGLDRDTVEGVMLAIVESGAFEDLLGPVKAVLRTREDEIIYQN